MRTSNGLIGGVFLAAVASGSLHAASFDVSPVLMDLAPGQTTATITLSNRGERPVAIQARPFAWSQTGDDDSLTPTQDMILSPPIFTVAPDSAQTVRLLLRGGGIGSNAERHYRILLDEVPTAMAGRRSVTVALRLSMPVIAEPASATPGPLRWSLERSAAGRLDLTAINTGGTYAKIQTIEVTFADGRHAAVKRAAPTPYVLPGVARHWILQDEPAALGGPLHLSVTTQAGKTEQILVP